MVCFPNQPLGKVGLGERLTGCGAIVLGEGR